MSYTFTNPESALSMPYEWHLDQVLETLKDLGLERVPDEEPQQWVPPAERAFFPGMMGEPPPPRLFYIIPQYPHYMMNQPPPAAAPYLVNQPILVPMNQPMMFQPPPHPQMHPLPQLHMPPPPPHPEMLHQPQHHMPPLPQPFVPPPPSPFLSSSSSPREFVPGQRWLPAPKTSGEGEMVEHQSNPDPEPEPEAGPSNPLETYFQSNKFLYALFLEHGLKDYWPIFDHMELNFFASLSEFDLWESYGLRQDADYVARKEIMKIIARLNEGKTDGPTLRWLMLP